MTPKQLVLLPKPRQVPVPSALAKLLPPLPIIPFSHPLSPFHILDFTAQPVAIQEHLMSQDLNRSLTKFSFSPKEISSN